MDIITTDASGLRDIVNDPVGHVMLRAMIDLGHQLGLKVVAA